MKIEHAQLLYEGWGKYLLLHLLEDDGQKRTYAVDDHGDAACVLPYNPTTKSAIILAQWRVPLFYLGARECRILEAPAGRLEDADPELCAQREAMEEAGVLLPKLENIGCFWSMPGCSTERLWLYLAPIGACDRISDGGGLADENEDIEVLEIPLKELAQLADTANLPDLKTFAALQTLRLRRPDLFT